MERYLCLSVDVQGYGARNDVQQRAIQAELVDLLNRAGELAGVARASWLRQPKGDEELALIPSSEPHQLVVGEFCLRLAELLRQHNERGLPGQGDERGLPGRGDERGSVGRGDERGLPGRGDERGSVGRGDERGLSGRGDERGLLGRRGRREPLRLRLALDEGPVELAANGFAGRAVVGVSRLVNAAPLRQALALAAGASLAVIVSQGVYRDWVASGRSSLGPERFRRVSVAEKEFVEDAWLLVPDADVHQLALTGTATVPMSVAAGASLPAPAGHFCGRDAELARVLAALHPTGAWPLVCAISGMAGVGKSALAVHAAHRLLASHANSYPDGCVFVDLHGYTTAAAPKQPAEVLHKLLRRLGVPAVEIPAEFDERVEQFREWLRGRRMLFVLDNALDVAQVRALLPTVAGCAALVTSRARLTALDEATLVALDVLSEPDGAALFSSVAGVPRGPDVDRLVERCGRLPLAIRIVAARHRVDPAPSLEALADRLTEFDGLDAFDDGDRSVAACLAVSHASLPQPQQRLFSLLAVHPGDGFSGYAAAALGGLGKTDARRLLDGLVERHLLLHPEPDRYRFHDLVRSFARQYHAPRGARFAVRRLVDYYLSAAASADEAITPRRYAFEIGAHRPSWVPDLRDPNRALAWLLTEERTLLELGRVAAEHRLDVQCWQLSHVLRGFYFLTKRWSPWAETHAVALAATRRLGDRYAEAVMLSNCGLVANELGDPAAAASHYRAALALFEQIGDERGAYAARTNLAWAGFYQGHYAEFIRELRQTHAFYAINGSTRNAAIALRGIALGEIEIGALDDAIRHLGEAQDVFERAGPDLDLAMTRNALGEAYARAGDRAAAAEHHREALAISRRCGSAFEWARAQHRLGDLAAAGGEPERARERWLEALTTYRALGAPQAAELVASIG